jgi:hypothetical protein
MDGVRRAPAWLGPPPLIMSDRQCLRPSRLSAWTEPDVQRDRCVAESRSHHRQEDERVRRLGSIRRPPFESRHLCISTSLYLDISVFRCRSLYLYLYLEGARPVPYRPL